MSTGTNSTLVMPVESDWTRAMRMFTGMANTIVGSDQNLNGEDPYASNQTGQYTIANPDGTYATMGLARSSMQSPLQGNVGGGLLPLVALAGVAFYLLKGKS